MQLNNEHKAILKSIFGGTSGARFKDYLELVVRELVDIRNIKDGDVETEKRARERAVEIIEEYLLSKARIVTGEVEENSDSFE